MKLRLGNEENARHYGVETGDMIDISFQDYLKGVVASEIGNAHIEACKAQAIASRTNTYAYLKSNKTISDSSKDIQAFRAERLYGYPNAYRAVEETNGQVQFYDGDILSPCPYSASNGGRTISSEERWGGYRPYQIAQDDPWDKKEKRGHGVGMSQEGAIYAAKDGIGHKSILSFYYPGSYIGEVKERDEKTVAVKASYQVEKFKLMVDQKWKYVAGGASKGEVDCSGAFTYWYKQAGGYMYHGSNTMWRKYSTQKGKIGSVPLVPGMAVYKWRNDGKEPMSYQDDGIGNFYHVGLYIGNDRVVEAKGTRYGVVYSDIYEWTYASKLKDTVYDLVEEGSSSSSSSSFFPSVGIVTTEGGTLRVRKAPVDGDVLGKLSNGTSITLTGEVDGWYTIEYKGHVGYISGEYVKVNKEDASTKWKIIFTTANTNMKDEIVAQLEGLGITVHVEELKGQDRVTEQE